uniref:ERI1 exoribonuclease family member 3 n=1 Tax=Leptobrachium leishanense TaxID=445787 RepID=A0A8C5QYF3_9ANUR
MNIWSGFHVNAAEDSMQLLPHIRPGRLPVQLFTRPLGAYGSDPFYLSGAEKEFNPMLNRRLGSQGFGGSVAAMTSFPPQRYHYFLVLDFEATCDKPQIHPQEIIEFPILKLNGRTMEIESTFHTYVQPVVHPQLTPFATELTGIIQEMVDNQPTLCQVLERVEEWMAKEGLLDPSVKSIFVTCGDWDLKLMLPGQCEYLGLQVADYFKQWINLKKHRTRRGNLARLRLAHRASWGSATLTGLPGTPPHSPAFLGLRHAQWPSWVSAALTGLPGSPPHSPAFLGLRRSHRPSWDSATLTGLPGSPPHSPAFLGLRRTHRPPWDSAALTGLPGTLPHSPASLGLRRTHRPSWDSAALTCLPCTPPRSPAFLGLRRTHRPSWVSAALTCLPGSPPHSPTFLGLRCTHLPSWVSAALTGLPGTLPHSPAFLGLRHTHRPPWVSAALTGLPGTPPHSPAPLGLRRTHRPSWVSAALTGLPGTPPHSPAFLGLRRAYRPSWVSAALTGLPGSPPHSPAFLGSQYNLQYLYRISENYYYFA